MTEHDTAHPDSERIPNGDSEFAGEEDPTGQATPGKDLGSACVIGALSIAVMVMSLRLDIPGSVSTAPGLLPFVTSLSLLLMAVVLGVRAVQAGGARGFVSASRRASEAFLSSEEGRRSLLLIVIIVAYVLLVGVINFDLRLPTPVFVFRLSSYEVISIAVITLIMKLFWKGPLTRCFLVSLITIEVLAAIFRYAFGIIMPESF
ncbi:MAG: hypothetical protein IIA33_10400 [Planctomycetes bacterium]|nr:hypothetical protein [Planctomycetota bacterium]